MSQEVTHFLHMWRWIVWPRAGTAFCEGAGERGGALLGGAVPAHRGHGVGVVPRAQPAPKVRALTLRQIEHDVWILRPLQISLHASAWASHVARHFDIILQGLRSQVSAPAMLHARDSASLGAGAAVDYLAPNEQDV